jgi:hypothetical protein
VCFSLWTSHVGGRAHLSKQDLQTFCVFLADVTKLAVLSNVSMNSLVIMNCKGCGRKGSWPT